MRWISRFFAIAQNDTYIASVDKQLSHAKKKLTENSGLFLSIVYIQPESGKGATGFS